MNMILWLAIGGLAGWLCSRLMQSEGQQGLALDVVVGMAGAFAGGYLVGPWFGASSIDQQDINLASLGISLLGAIVLLAVVSRLYRRALLR